MSVMGCLDRALSVLNHPLSCRPPFFCVAPNNVDYSITSVMDLNSTYAIEMQHWVSSHTHTHPKHTSSLCTTLTKQFLLMKKKQQVTCNTANNASYPFSFSLHPLGRNISCTYGSEYLISLLSMSVLKLFTHTCLDHPHPQNPHSNNTHARTHTHYSDIHCCYWTATTSILLLVWICTHITCTIHTLTLTFWKVVGFSLSSWCTNIMQS